jgi:uncharacterized repeat protein (TIGR03806 family)
LALLFPNGKALGDSLAFRRGDSNNDSQLNLTDALQVLGYLFLGERSALDCLDAADSNDDGGLNLADAIYVLRHLFLGGPSPPAPFWECGLDPTEDALDCVNSRRCPQCFSGPAFDVHNNHEPPVSLSESGFVDPDEPQKPLPCFIPYGVNVSFWSDGAEKDRWLALPDGATIDILPDGEWELPVGTVLLKNFRLDHQLVETRLLMRGGQEFQQGWRGYTYEWNEAATDATLIPDGENRERVVNGKPWIYPSRDDCFFCHNQAAGYALGLETLQLNRSFPHPRTGREANQLATFEHLGLFKRPLSRPPAELPALPATADTSQLLHLRARAYLHANCSDCHRPGGPGQWRADFRFYPADPGESLCNVLAPGDPEHSAMVGVMRSLDADLMPPVGRHAVDEQGVELISAWIASLTECDPACGDDGCSGTGLVNTRKP